MLRKIDMGVYFEALILYMVLFLSGSMGRAEGPVDFSVAAELTRIFLYSIPSLALIWYLLLKVKSFKDWEIGLPNKKDLFAGLLSLLGLLLIGFTIAFATSFFNATSGETGLSSPSSVPGWIILSVSCISSAYLEESFFRFYFLSRQEELKLSGGSALLLSTIAFSICHFYEGPWGFLNSFLSGILLCYIFLRYKSLHGIALAHGLYNIIVYILSAVH